MTLLVRQIARQQTARSFFRDIYNENDFFYIFVSRAHAWDDESSPETPRDSQFYVQQYKHDMLFVKRVQATDTVLLANRHDWVNGTIYDQYDDEYATGHASYSGATNLADATFFVLTDEFNVYKCLNNNINSASTVKPTATGTDIFELDDGYIWKSMYQIGSADRTKFLTTGYMPVRKIAGAGNPLFDVNGEIDGITVTAGGSGYATVPTVVIQGDGTGATATAVLTGNAVTSITIATAGRGFSFAVAKITGGGGTGATATVQLGSTEIPSLQQAVEATAVSGTVDRIVVTTGGIDYVSGDVVVVLEGDGEGATASATINSAGTVTGVSITNPGSGYTFVNATVSQTIGSGTGISLRAIVSPYEGHGGNPPKELYAKSVGVTSSFVSDNDDLIIGNEFRQIGMIKNIHNYAETESFSAAIGTPCFVVTTSTPDLFNLDDVLTSSADGKFRVIQKLDLTGDGNTETIYLQEQVPGIIASSTFVNLNTGTSGITINTVTNPEIANHSGDVLYIDNKRPITRDAEQVETIKVIFNF